jgi:TonB family protein
MGRTGLRAVLRWCLCFCAALATASIPVASAQTRAPKIVPPTQNAALSPANKTPAPATSSPEETSSPAPESADDAAAKPAPKSEFDPAHPAPEPMASSAANPRPKPAAEPSPNPASLSAAEPPSASPVVPAVAFTPPDGLPLAGERGVTHPVCLQCPPALYSYPALLKRVQGNVTMDAIISKDGWASDVKILGSLGSGLDEQAMKTVRTWQWKPARDANGSPVVAHQTVVIAFRVPK